MPTDSYFVNIRDLFEKLEGVDTIMEDPQTTSVRLVTNPERMVLRETQREEAVLVMEVGAETQDRLSIGWQSLRAPRWTGRLVDEHPAVVDAAVHDARALRVDEILRKRFVAQQHSGRSAPFLEGCYDIVGIRDCQFGFVQRSV